MPGFDEKGVKVTALPDAFIVSGEKRMLRRFELTSLINTDKIYAKLENGLLKLTAHKLKTPEPATVHVSAV